MNLPLGQIVVTQRAEELLEASGLTINDLLQRHRAGDWGDSTAEERRLNENALSNSMSVISSFLVGAGERLTVHTRPDRSVTMVHVAPAVSRVARTA